MVVAGGSPARGGRRGEQAFDVGRVEPDLEERVVRTAALVQDGASQGLEDTDGQMRPGAQALDQGFAFSHVPNSMRTRARSKLLRGRDQGASGKAYAEGGGGRARARAIPGAGQARGETEGGLFGMDAVGGIGQEQAPEGRRPRAGHGGPGDAPPGAGGCRARACRPAAPAASAWNRSPSAAHRQSSTLAAASAGVSGHTPTSAVSPGRRKKGGRQPRGSTETRPSVTSTRVDASVERVTVNCVPWTLTSACSVSTSWR
jgi:hypothetical protein